MISFSVFYPVLCLATTTMVYFARSLVDAGRLRSIAFPVLVIAGVSFLYGVTGYLSVSDAAYSLDWERISYEISWAREVGPLPLLMGSYSAHPLSAFLMYFVGLLGDPALIRFLSCFAFGACVGTMAWRLGYRAGAIATALVWFCAFATVDFGNSLLVNIRFELAAIVCVYAILTLLIFNEGRLHCYFLMAVGFGLHSGTVFLIALYFLTVTCRSRGTKRSLLLLLVIFGPLIVAFAPVLSTIPVIGQKISAYVGSGWGNGAVSFKNLLFNLLLPLVGLTCSVLVMRLNREAVRPRLCFLGRYVVHLSLFSLSMALLTDNFARYAQLVPLFLMPLLILGRDEEWMGFRLKCAGRGGRVNLMLLGFTGIAFASLLFRSIFTYRFYWIALM